MFPNKKRENTWFPENTKKLVFACISIIIFKNNWTHIFSKKNTG
jgi:hypothetical protein